MKSVIIFILVYSSILFSSTFQLSTMIEDKQLVPVIKINGQNVIQISEVGAKQTYASTFERCEKIFKSLKNLQNNQDNFNRIRIRRNKSDYVAYVDDIEVYRVTPSDTVGSDLTVYQMAAKWRSNIMDAIKETNPDVVVGDESIDDSYLVPLISVLSIFSNSSVLVMLFQMSIFLIIQIGAIFLVFKYFNHKYHNIDQDLQDRIKKMDLVQSSQKNIINRLENQLIEVYDNINHKKSDSNITNIGGSN